MSAHTIQGQSATPAVPEVVGQVGSLVGADVKPTPKWSKSATSASVKVALPTSSLGFNLAGGNSGIVGFQDLGVMRSIVTDNIEMQALAIKASEVDVAPETARGSSVEAVPPAMDLPAGDADSSELRVTTNDEHTTGDSEAAATTPVLDADVAAVADADAAAAGSGAGDAAKYKLVTIGDIQVEVPVEFELTPTGLHIANADPKTKGKPVRLCGQILVTAWLRSPAGNNWSVQIEFHDRDGMHRSKRIPMSHLSSKRTKVWDELASMGFGIPNVEHREMVATYLEKAKPRARGWAVNQPGWTNGVYVMPDGTAHGAGEQAVIYDAPAPHLQAGFEAKGSLEGWQQNVAAPCLDNSRPVFGLSIAFASPLLRLLREENGAVNLKGTSSIGKSTAQKIAASVWGNPGQLTHSWRGTVNGFEAVAAQYNDGMLVLDEIGEALPRDVDTAVYMVMNGTGKVRSNLAGNVRPLHHWSLMCLSSGEIDIADHLSAGGVTAKAGQDVRMPSVPADAGQGHGVFDTLHGRPDGGALSLELKRACSAYHGTAIRGFIERLVDSETQDAILISARACMAAFESDVGRPDDSGQVQRVAHRFALIAAAGEAAIAAGILPFPEGHATWAAKKCFEAWIESRGGNGQMEVEQSLEIVRKFLLVYGNTNFRLLKVGATAEAASATYAGKLFGFRQPGSDNRMEYWIPTEVFKKEVCRGLDHTQVAKQLLAKGYLVPDSAGKSSVSKRVPDHGNMRVYVITADLLGSADQAEAA